MRQRLPRLPRHPPRLLPTQWSNCQLRTPPRRHLSTRRRLPRMLARPRLLTRRPPPCQKLARQQAEREEAILNGPQPTPSDTEAAFFQCYQRATNAPAILSSKMHWTLKRAGFRLTQKVMNTWIREHFKDDEEVTETRPQNKLCWKGFKPVSAT